MKEPELFGATFRDGVLRFVREYDAAQRATGETRRRLEAEAAARLRGWVMREWPEDMGGQTVNVVRRPSERQRKNAKGCG
jgi:hypothetical protein